MKLLFNTKLFSVQFSIHALSIRSVFSQVIPMSQDHVLSNSLRNSSDEVFSETLVCWSTIIYCDYLKR